MEALAADIWPLVSMGAILAGTMRAPFTAILFALELTHDVNVLLPLLVAAMLAHATTVLLLKRSILTEKVARRGFHLSREYATDPLEILLAREVMRTRARVTSAASIRKGHQGEYRPRSVVRSRFPPQKGDSDPHLKCIVIFDIFALF